MAAPKYPRRSQVCGIAAGLGVAALALTGCGRTEDFDPAVPPVTVHVDAGEVVPPDAALPAPDASDYLAGGAPETPDFDAGTP